MIASYINGNTYVSIYEDGTKIREWDGTPVAMFPESMDVKITDYCDMGCPFCHEGSCRTGLHADLDRLLLVINDLPSGVELAIGGGNPLSHPELTRFLRELQKRGIIANITINQQHIKGYRELIVSMVAENLIKGIGISVTDPSSSDLLLMVNISDNVVFHVIAGVHDVSIMGSLSRYPDSRVLILGYKIFGRGKGFYSSNVESNIDGWKKSLQRYIGGCVMAFDNLAIEQLNVRRFFTQKGWDRFYMGDDFSFTMYIDAVKQEYAPTSCATSRTSFRDTALLEFFKGRLS